MDLICWIKHVTESCSAYWPQPADRCLDLASYAALASCDEESQRVSMAHWRHVTAATRVIAMPYEGECCLQVS